jgi:hypothetical protein
MLRARVFTEQRRYSMHITVLSEIAFSGLTAPEPGDVATRLVRLPRRR